MERELHVAQVIQKTLLPKEIPVLPGWEIAAHWQPAQAVSGDFYDFILFPDGQLGLVIADVTDKGVPAGLVMASARSILRGVSERLRSPGAVLERTNNLMVGDIPKNMFVTCLYAVIDPNTGIMRYANAGQNLPYRNCDGQVTQLDATGLPLGLMVDMGYDEFETRIEPGELLFFYSDGLVEAHNQHQQMFGDRRLESLMHDRGLEDTTGSEMIQIALNSLRGFTGEEWSQEDDVTLMTIRRLPIANQELEMERSMAGE
jgi:serine phosphatase RsbU (regulator of sigma subunit)